MLAKLIADARKRANDFEAAIVIAEVHAARKETDRAFEWLRTARQRAEKQDSSMSRWVFNDSLQVAPFLKPLHSDPRWKALTPELTVFD